jgi:hypothetical protein
VEIFCRKVGGGTPVLEGLKLELIAGLEIHSHRRFAIGWHRGVRCRE